MWEAPAGLREGNAPGFGSSDIVMMALTGGAERTAREFVSLLARAGLTMTRVLPTTTSASIVEAHAAQTVPKFVFVHGVGFSGAH
jgi:hypothetical protein